MKRILLIEDSTDFQKAVLFRYEYVVIEKKEAEFKFKTVGNFYLNLISDEMNIVNPTGFDFSASFNNSPVREGLKPGSYVKKNN
jgi:hypothetical protein